MRFHPDPEIFGPTLHFKPAMIYRLARSKAYLFKGVEIRWHCDDAVVRPPDLPQDDVLHFPGGLADFLKNVAITAGPAVASQTGFSAAQREVIAFAFQFGSLILPAIVPAIVWVLMHRRFLERLRGVPDVS